MSSKAPLLEARPRVKVDWEGSREFQGYWDTGIQSVQTVARPSKRVLRGLLTRA